MQPPVNNDAVAHILDHLVRALDAATTSEQARNIEEAMHAARCLRDGYDDLQNAIRELRISEHWTVVDRRTGKPATVAGCPSKSSAMALIEEWRERDKRGGRPDCHEQIHFLEPTRLR